jgi:sarcosine oxidase subunit beta
VRDLLLKPKRMWRRRDRPKDRYDVVIIGGGSHGLATAYYLAQNGITDVCILEKGYIGSGAAGRNTSILRSNYRTPEGVRFYQESLRLYERLSVELGYNLLFSQRGHLTLAHSDRSEAVLTERAAVNRLLDVDSRMIGVDEIHRLAPALRLTPNADHPVRSALYHPPGGTIRHDAVVWGFARAADRGGAEIHPCTEVTAVYRDNGRVTGVETTKGRIAAGTVVSCTAGWSSLTAGLAGVKLPITTHPLQAFVTEPLKPLLDVVIVSADLHVYISQTDRGEFLVGAEIEPWTSYRQQGTLNFLEDASRHTLELLPQLEKARMLRSWAGLCDISPDYSPILGLTDVDGFLVSAGWGTYGFKAAPIVGKSLAELIATQRTPELIEPFALERFYNDEMVSELAAAAVSH